MTRHEMLTLAARLRRLYTAGHAGPWALRRAVWLRSRAMCS